jgi:hypothetical protein
MSKIDINEYKEVAAHALNILQKIMNQPFGDPTAKAIAAAAVLNHCKSVIERERQQVSCALGIVENPEYQDFGGYLCKVLLEKAGYFPSDTA